MSDLEDKFSQAPEFHDLLLRESAPDRAWEKWVSMVHSTAETHFAKGSAVDPLVVQFQQER
eukprot:2562452-Pyramimonas_sp.AAC.1